MPLGRRQFLVTAGAGALVACGPSLQSVRGPLASPGLDDVLDAALSAARRAGASYVDARIVRRRTEVVRTRDDVLVQVRNDESYGVGVRVLVDGAWGFAATSRVEANAAAGAAERAVGIARANARLVVRRVELAKVDAYRATWSTDLQVNPFDVPLAERVHLLLSIWRDARAVPEVKHGDGAVELLGEWKLFASTEGSRIEQSITRLEPSFTVTAIDSSKGDFVTRAHEIPPRQAGWEYVTGSTFRADGRRIAEDAVRKLHAPTVVPGKRDIILSPSHLWLVIHESIRPLDRARPRARLRGGPRRHVVRNPRQARQAPLRRPEPHLLRRQDHPRRPRHLRLRRRRRADAALRHHQGGCLRRVPDDARTGRLGGREALAGDLLRRGLPVGPVPAHAKRIARAIPARGLARGSRGGYRRRYPHHRRRLVVHRPPALQLPVRRPDVLGREEGEDPGAAARRRLPV